MVFCVYLLFLRYHECLECLCGDDGKLPKILKVHRMVILHKKVSYLFTRLFPHPSFKQ